MYLPQDEINHHINPDRSIAARVLGLAWPVIVENSLMTMVNEADVAMVGRLGKVAIASASLPGSPIFFSQALFSAISIGTTALVARLIGAREKDQANKALRQSFFIAVILGLIVTAILVGFARPIMSLMGATGEVLTTSSMYLRVSCSTFFFMTCRRYQNANDYQYHRQLRQLILKLRSHSWHCLLSGNGSSRSGLGNRDFTRRGGITGLRRDFVE
jgi:Na+-driven multidrug efflux pump